MGSDSTAGPPAAPKWGKDEKRSEGCIVYPTSERHKITRTCTGRGDNRGSPMRGPDTTRAHAALIAGSLD